MYIYWRVQQDLSCLGEVIQFHNPSFIRNHREWIKRNATGIAIAETMCNENSNNPMPKDLSLNFGNLNLIEFSRN